MAENPSLTKNPHLDSWIVVTSSGQVQVRMGKVDIGQKISSAVSRLAAEELDVEPERIVMIRPNTVDGPDEGMTSGSNSMEESGNAIRLASATARAAMVALAAEALGVDADELDVTDGTITARSTNRSTSYWDLQGDKAFGIPIDLAAQIKPATERTLVGQPTTPLDLEDIVTGRHVFVNDMSMDAMVHARPVRPPHALARLKGLDDRALKKLSDGGFFVVRDGSFLAIAGADEYRVIKAADTLRSAATWTKDPDLGDRDIYEQLTTNDRLSMPVVNGVPVDAPMPPPLKTLADAKASHTARYERAYIMHASIGPSAALAVMKDDGLELWTHSQGIYLLRASLAELFEVPPEQLRLHHRPGSGCYGHNGADDAAVDAALVARALPGVPVLMKWTREDEHAWEPYSPAMVMELSGAISNQGEITAWSHESHSDTHVLRPRPGVAGLGSSRLLPARYLANPPTVIPPPPNLMHHGGIHRNQEPLYRIPSPRLVKHLVRGLPHRTSALRTLGAFANVFALESFLDELAAMAGEDSVKLRLRHMDDPRARACINAVAERIGPLDQAPDGHGRGLGFAQYKNAKAYAAVAVELAVDEGARVRLKRAVIAGDAGQIVDPTGFTAQLEGGFIQAASWTIYEAVTHDPGGITSRDWESYPIIGFDNIPEIETILLDQPDAPFLGAGEAVCGPTGAAIANAVHRATGVRPRRLPLTSDNLRAAALAT
ncbi:MAG: molybdopterin-dependent oxidoreductase [Alphaproteobacteria bacterium]|nr:molybdopterin-dependent oxidoreductase [Alphaproteobacteria bacterium]